MKNLKFTLLLFISLGAPAMGIAQNWTKIWCGGEFSIGLKKDGTLWAWGNNDNGQLGIGGTMTQELPVQVGHDNDWKTASAGGAHVLAIKKDGTLWGWGNSTYGQAGTGTNTQVNDEPTQISNDTGWVAISAGYATSFAIKSNGMLYCWGWNFFGQLGDSSEDNGFAPRFSKSTVKFRDVSAGSLHTVAVAQNGTMWAWGYNNDGELGTGNNKNSDYPVRVGKDSDWARVFCAQQYCIALKTDGSIWSWGVNSSGQMGIDSVNSSFTPKMIGTDKDWADLAIGSSFAFGLKNDHTLWGWGDNRRGQLGLDTMQRVRTPMKVGTASDWTSIAAAVGYVKSQSSLIPLGFHAIGIRSGETGYCATGVNSSFQLGKSDDTSRLNTFYCDLGTRTGIDGQALDKEMKVYPNPSSGSFTLQCSFASAGARTLCIRNVTGQTIMQTVLQNEPAVNIDLGAYPKGIYFVNIISGSEAYTQKLMLE